MTALPALMLIARAAVAGYGFHPGEQLTFDVKWFFITAGQATMTVEPNVEVNDARCMHFIATARSQLVFFFTVNDLIESWSAAEDLVPVRYLKHLREGGYHKDQEASFDRKRGIATWSGEEIPWRPECRDLLGQFYYLRSMRFPEPGGKVEMCVHTGKKNNDLLIEVVGREKMKVPAGTFATIHVKPKLKFEGLFRQEGDIDIWMTDDEAHVPVLVKSKVHLLGSVNIVLTKKTTP